MAPGSPSGSRSLGHKERVRVQLPPGRAASVRGAGFVRFVVSFKQSQRPSGAGATALHTRGHLGPEEQSDRPRAAQPGGGVGSEPRKPGSLAAARDVAGSCRRAQRCAPSSAALSLSHRGPRLSRGLMTQFPSRAGSVSPPRHASMYPAAPLPAGGPVHPAPRAGWTVPQHSASP